MPVKRLLNVQRVLSLWLRYLAVLASSAVSSRCCKAVDVICLFACHTCWVVCGGGEGAGGGRGGGGNLNYMKRKRKGRERNEEKEEGDIVKEGCFHSNSMTHRGREGRNADAG